ncbi:carbohydrate ABC transporter permease [Brachybacterium sp. FME24]|uniref:carbohydrate ABC transporter permease n=1 Tax=Brachybacterium sp. FME24 TaxID=2742605 RepID=UPI001D03374F|nr:carbohydrate ABC transporter permease [Brachybacterium sp. FME24]
MITNSMGTKRPSDAPHAPGGAHPAAMIVRRKQPASVRVRKNLIHIPLIIMGLVTLFPFLAMLSISLRPGEAVSVPDIFINPNVSLAAYVEALSNSRIPRWALNTTIYAVVSVVMVLLFASMAGYAFAKKKFLGREVIFWVFIAMLMIPYQLTIIPQYLIVGQMGGLNTMWGLIVPTIANAQAMFLMRQFIQDIPDELIDAAKIDGAGEFRVYWSIILPQTKPILATLGTFVFLWHWNDFLWPLVSQQSPDNYLLTVGLNSLQSETVSLATLMASAVVTFIPALLVFIFLQRYFVRGVMMSGIK